MANERLQLILEPNTGQYTRKAREAASSLKEIKAEAVETEAAAKNLDDSFRTLPGKIGKSEAEARELADSVSKSVRESRELDDELRAVARGLGLSEQEAAEFAREMRRARDNTDDVDKSVGRLNQGFSKMKGLIVAAIAAFSIQVGLRQASNAIESFNLLNESVNAVNVAFGEGAGQVFEYGETVHRTAGLARGAFQQLVVPIGAQLRNFGFEAGDAAEAAVILTQRAADLASVFNTEVPEALGAIQAALRGESDPIEKFGASISAARVEALALSMGLASSKAELDDTAKVTARYNLILQDTARVHGDFAKTAEDPANAARILAAEAENARAALGERLIPAWIEVLRVAPDVIESLEDIGPAIETLALTVSANADEIAGGVETVINVIARLGIAAEIVFLQGQDLWNLLFGSDTELTSAFNEATGEFELIVEGIDKASDRAKRMDALYRQLDLVTSLQNGVAPLNALGAAVRAVGTDGGNLRSEFSDLARIAGLSGTDLVTAIDAFLQKGPNLRLFGDDVEYLQFQLAVLKDEIAFSGDVGFIENIEDLGDQIGALPDIAGSGVASLRDLQAAAAEADLSLSEAFDQGVEAGQFFDGLAQVEAHVAGFRDRINAIGREIDPMKGATEQLDISMEEFLANFLGSFEQEAEFQANLTRLTDAGFGAMADRIEAVGPGLNDLTIELLQNLDQVGAAETSAANTATAYENALRQELIAGGWDALGADVSLSLFGGIGDYINRNAGRLSEDQMRDLAAGVTTPQALTFATGAGEEVAEKIDLAIREFIRDHKDEIGYDAVRDLAAGVTSIEALEEMMRAGQTVADVLNRAVAENVRFDFDLPSPGGGRNVPSLADATRTSTVGGRLAGGPVMADFQYRVGENNRPELLMIPGDRGQVFSNADVQQLIAVFSGGGPSGSPLQVHVHSPSSTVDVARGVQEGLLLAGISRMVEVNG